MSEPKKHHFLPQFYLRGFSINSREQIWQIEKTQHPESRKVAIKDAACETHYHTIDADPKNKDRRTIEEYLSGIEGKQAELINTITGHGGIQSYQKRRLAEFIMIMRFRVPAYKTYIEQTLGELVRNSTRLMFRMDKFPPPPPQVEELIKEKDDDIFDVEISNWMILVRMLNIALDPKFVQIIERMNLSLYKTPEGLEFVACDSPVAIFDPNYKKKKPYGVGLLNRDIDLTFPLTKRYLVLASWKAGEGTCEAAEYQINEFNRRTVIMAKKYIWASSQTKQLTDLISSYCNKKAGFEISSMDYGKGFAQITRFIPVTS